MTSGGETVDDCVAQIRNLLPVVRSDSIAAVRLDRSREDHDGGGVYLDLIGVGPTLGTLAGLHALLVGMENDERSPVATSHLDVSWRLVGDVGEANHGLSRRRCKQLGDGAGPCVVRGLREDRRSDAVAEDQTQDSDDDSLDHGETLPLSMKVLWVIGKRSAKSSSMFRATCSISH